ncbi:hypothetical protein [Thermoleptolyngbya oregonensis]|uniref:ABC transporter permease n=1 Tax=Thermoleptolyngbya oregonensis TaxID=2303529 RepID=UPI0029303BE2|nr:hypothetical protein [Thermoleptolyngbya oregonensis]
MVTQSSSTPSTHSPISPWQPVWEIVRFELQDSLRTRSLLLGFGFFFVLGLVFIHGMGSDVFFFPAIRQAMGLGTRPGELVPYANAPLRIMRVFMTANLFFILLTVGIFTERATKDFTSSMDGLLFTSPLKEWQFGAGRFIASAVMVVVMSLGLGLGMLVAERLPWMAPARIGPFNLLAYLQPYLYLILPNLLIFGLLSFGLGLLTRRSLAGYLGLVAVLLLQVVLEGILGLLRAGPFFVALINPLGSTPIDYTVRFWTKIEQNTLNVPFAPVIWLSRLLYLALSIVFFVWVWRQFSFSGGASESQGRLEKLLDWAEDRLIFWKKAKPQAETASAAPLVRDLAPAPATQPHYGLGAQVNHVWRIAKLDLKRLIWNPLTLAILTISLITTGFLLVLMFASGGSPVAHYKPNCRWHEPGVGASCAPADRVFGRRFGLAGAGGEGRSSSRFPADPQLELCGGQAAGAGGDALPGPGVDGGRCPPSSDLQWLYPVQPGGLWRWPVYHHPGGFAAGRRAGHDGAGADEPEVFGLRAVGSAGGAVYGGGELCL